MRVLITGGSGLVGRALATDLAQDGNEVVVLSRSPSGAAGLPAGVHAEQWDGRTAGGWASLANGADAIVNLAGENIGAGRWTANRKQTIRESRLNAGSAVVQAVELAAKKPRVVVQASAVGYYGPCRDEEVTEATPPGNDFLAGVVADWETSTVPVEAMGVRRAVIRSGVVLSTKGGALPRMLLPFRMFVGGRTGSGRQWLSWIHMSDEVKAIRFLIDNESARGTFNLSAPTPITNAEFTRLLGKHLHRPALAPTPALLLRALFGEMSTVLLDGQRAVPRRLLELGFSFQFPTADSALEDLLDRPSRK
ncbi:MAG: TIGR01777 family protein [Chloroflexi bacterium]|nr:TIGR01777 family protein [Chloroflexota bacterium]